MAERRSALLSHLPMESLSYERVVAEYFLALRGTGLMLSPLDAEQIRAWERRGLPVAVVCRGLHRGLEEARREREANLPRSLRAFRRTVEDEWRAYRGGRVGDAPPPPAEAALASRRLGLAREMLLAASRRSTGPRREAYLEALRMVDAAADDPDALETAFRAADASLIRAWLAALAAAERAALGPRCRLRAGPRDSFTRPRAYREALRSHLLDAAKEAGLLCLRGSV
jgi:hypothetical protein